MRVAYIICAAGLGTRTRVINSRLPKPLISLNGQLLIEHAIASLCLRTGDVVLIAGLSDHRLSRAKDRIRSRWPGVAVKWIDIEKPTGGQLETAVFCLKYVENDFSVAIFNADSSFAPIDLREVPVHWEGIIPCSEEKGDAWSFCAVENETVKLGQTCEPLNAVSVAEKKRISKWCSVGFYFFREKSLFERFASEELAAANGETFVAPLYNRYITQAKPVGIVPAIDFRAMGSIDQFHTYWGKSLEDLKTENLTSVFETNS
jgi:dTDP-glucose pyrophosphorylase